MNELKYSLEIEGFGKIVNFKTDLLSAFIPAPQSKEKTLSASRSVDKYSPLFLQSAVRGENFPKASLRAERRENGNLRLLVIYSLSKVYIEEFQMHNDEDHFRLRFENIQLGISSMP